MKNIKNNLEKFNFFIFKIAKFSIHFHCQQFLYLFVKFLAIYQKSIKMNENFKEIMKFEEKPRRKAFFR